MRPGRNRIKKTLCVVRTAYPKGYLKLKVADNDAQFAFVIKIVSRKWLPKLQKTEI
jgi:hypothetical protein